MVRRKNFTQDKHRNLVLLHETWAVFANMADAMAPAPPMPRDSEEARNSNSEGKLSSSSQLFLFDLPPHTHSHYHHIHHTTDSTTRHTKQPHIHS